VNVFLIIPGVYWQEGGNDTCKRWIWRVLEKIRWETVCVCVCQRERVTLYWSTEMPIDPCILPSLVTNVITLTETHLPSCSMFYGVHATGCSSILYCLLLPLPLSDRMNHSCSHPLVSVNQSQWMNAHPLPQRVNDFFLSYFASFHINVLLANSSLANM